MMLNINKKSLKRLYSTQKKSYFNTALAKSSVSREKLKIKSVANNSAPCAFFVRSLRTPKINPNADLFSMVERNGRPLAVGCFPQIAVSHPVTRYRQTVRSLAAALKNIICGANAMYQFIFAAINRTDLTNKIQKIRIIAESEQQARAKLAREFILFFAGKISLKSHRALANVEGVRYV